MFWYYIRIFVTPEDTFQTHVCLCSLLNIVVISIRSYNVTKQYWLSQKSRVKESQNQTKETREFEHTITIYVIVYCLTNTIRVKHYTNVG